MVTCVKLLFVSEAHESWLIRTSAQNFCSALASLVVRVRALCVYYICVRQYTCKSVLRVFLYVTAVQGCIGLLRHINHQQTCQRCRCFCKFLQKKHQTTKQSPKDSGMCKYILFQDLSEHTERLCLSQIVKPSQKPHVKVYMLITNMQKQV